MGKKRLAINLITSLLSYGISIVVSFYLTPFLVNNIGKEVYGFYGLANNVVNYVNIISIALNSMAAKYITVELLQGNKIRANQYYTSIFVSNIALSVILAPVLLYIVVSIQCIFNISDIYLDDVRLLFALVFSTMIINLVSSIFGCATYTTNRIDLRAYTDLGRALLRVILYILVFTVFRPSIIYVGFVALILEVYNSIVQIFLKRRLEDNLQLKKKFFNLRLVIDTMKVGVWNSLNHLGDLLLSSSDLMVANIMIGESASGNISIIKTMPTLISGVITAINGVFMPRIVTRYAEGNHKELVNEVNMAQRIMGVFSTTTVMILILFCREFYELWVPGNDTDLLMRLSVIDILRMMLIGVVWPVSNLNIVMDKIKVPSLLVILSGILNIGGMYVLIRFTKMGIFAIPLTTLVLTILFYGIFIPLYPCRALEFKWNAFLTPIVEMMISAGVIVLIVLPIKGIFRITGWVTFIFYGGICWIIALIICLAVFVKPWNIKKILLTIKI